VLKEVTEKLKDHDILNKLREKKKDRHWWTTVDIIAYTKWKIMK